jgi:hypothetical protein
LCDAGDGRVKQKTGAQRCDLRFLGTFVRFGVLFGSGSGFSHFAFGIRVIRVSSIEYDMMHNRVRV